MTIAPALCIHFLLFWLLNNNAHHVLNKSLLIDVAHFCSWPADYYSWHKDEDRPAEHYS